MRVARIVLALILMAGAVVAGAEPSVHQPERCLGDPGQQPGWALSTTAFDPNFTSHAFVGNGYLSQRVPPTGTGYVGSADESGWPLYTPRYDGAFVAGLYGADPGLLNARHVAAALPTWSTLTVDVGSDSYTPATPVARISDYRQTLYLGCGVLRTTLTWTAADGRATDLEYDVLADQSDPHVGVVRLLVTPRWSGDLGVTDLIDGAGARRLEPTPDQRTEPSGTIAVPFRTETTGVAGAVVSTLRTGPDVVPTARLTADPAGSLTASQRLTLPVRAGRSYDFTKYVGVDTLLTSAEPTTAAYRAATAAASRGWSAVLGEQITAWQNLWRADILVPGQPQLQSWLRSGMYGLLSSIRAGQDTSISPTGLSSDNYAGLVFWDADLWMYPELLVQHPDLAQSIVAYRDKVLPTAESNAQRIGQQGAFFSWTSADTGDLWTDCESWGPPPHCLIQDHLQSDIALSAWQYYTETGDLTWLRQKGWPLVQGIAEYWAGRATANSDGSYSIRDIAGPDEYSNDVDDGVFTNAGAATALRDAIQAAALLGEQVPASWQTIADHLRIPYDPQTQVFQQYAGYPGSTIKQADTVMLQYPLEWPMTTQAASNTLDYYAQRTDPDGPAMTDAIHAIDSAQIGAPGCATYTYLMRASEPFIRAPFDQFSEARGAQAGQGAGSPAYDFLTGVGGLLQVFTNGLTGLRLRTDGVVLDPMLPPQLEPGVTLTGLHWQGRTFDVAVGPRTTTVTLRQGAPFPVQAPDGRHTVTAAAPLLLTTRRPDLTATDDLARCRPATASSADPGMYADAAVDGSTATAWSPEDVSGSLTVDLGQGTTIGQVSPQWSDVRPVSVQVEVSSDGQRFTPVAVGADGRLAHPVSARYVRLTVTGPAGDHWVRLTELTVQG